jgi:hypothetical protein
MNTKMGRPRVHPPEVTDTERSALSRQAVISAGGRTLSLLLAPETNQALSTVIAATGETMTGLISRLLAEEAQRIESEK